MQHLSFCSFFELPFPPAFFSINRETQLPTTLKGQRRNLAPPALIRHLVGPSPHLPWTHFSKTRTTLGWIASNSDKVNTWINRPNHTATQNFQMNIWIRPWIHFGQSYNCLDQTILTQTTLRPKSSLDRPTVVCPRPNRTSLAQTEFKHVSNYMATWSKPANKFNRLVFNLLWSNHKSMVVSKTYASMYLENHNGHQHSANIAINTDSMASNLLKQLVHAFHRMKDITIRGAPKCKCPLQLLLTEIKMQISHEQEVKN